MYWRDVSAVDPELGARGFAGTIYDPDYRH